ncbi:MAG: type II secretion system protein [Aquificota bacterium]|nr:MAG: type II secretion system protein [Aquificota bacterium]
MHGTGTLYTFPPVLGILTSFAPSDPMARRAQRTILMFGSFKGFTLLELLVAIAVVGVGFSTLFALLTKARSDYESARTLFEDLTALSNSLVEGKEDFLLKRERLKDYPEIEERLYRKGNGELFLYLPAR